MFGIPPLSTGVSLLIYFVIFYLQPNSKLYTAFKRCFITERSYVPGALNTLYINNFHLDPL